MCGWLAYASLKLLPNIEMAHPQKTLKHFFLDSKTDRTLGELPISLTENSCRKTFGITCIS